MNTVSITGLVQDFGDRGWSWTVTTVDDFGEDTSHYRTSTTGDGLFIYDGSVRQLKLTGEFSLRGCTKPAAYSRIRRYFAVNRREAEAGRIVEMYQRAAIMPDPLGAEALWSEARDAESSYWMTYEGLMPRSFYQDVASVVHSRAAAARAGRDND